MARRTTAKLVVETLGQIINETFITWGVQEGGSEDPSEE
jgi:hypothetical protein